MRRPVCTLFAPSSVSSCAKVGSSPMNVLAMSSNSCSIFKYAVELFILYLCVFLWAGLHVASHPHVGANHAMIAHGDAPQDGGIGIDHHIVADDGVAGDALDRVALVVEREASSSERHALIEFHVVADDAGGANHHARAMVDGEVVSMPVSEWAISVSMRGMRGTPNSSSSWARR